MKRILSFVMAVAFSAVLMAQSPSVAISIDSTTAFSITASFRMNDACSSYVILTAEAGSLDQYLMWGMTYEQMVSEWGIRYTHNDTYTWTELIPNTHYEIYAVAQGGGEESLCVENAYTATIGGMGTSEIQITVTEIADTTARVICVPNDETAWFVDMLITQAAFDSMGREAAVELLHEEPYIQYQADDWRWMTLTAGTAYYALAQGKNLNDEWGTLAQVPFSTQGGAAIAQRNENVRFEVYPNPAAGFVTVSNLVVGCRVSLCDVAGRVVKQVVSDGEVVRVSLEGSPKGLYFVRVLNPATGACAVRTVVKGEL